MSRPTLDALIGDFSPREAALGEDYLSQMQNHFRDLQAFEAHQAHGAWIEAVRPEFGPGVAERFAYAASVTAEQKRAADEFRVGAREIIEDLLGAEGFFALPTTPFFAPPLGESEQELAMKRNQMVRLFQIASFWSAASQPAAQDARGAAWAVVDRPALVRPGAAGARRSGWRPALWT